MKLSQRHGRQRLEVRLVDVPLVQMAQDLVEPKHQRAVAIPPPVDVFAQVVQVIGRAGCGGHLLVEEIIQHVDVALVQPLRPRFPQVLPVEARRRAEGNEVQVHVVPPAERHLVRVLPGQDRHHNVDAHALEDCPCGLYAVLFVVQVSVLHALRKARERQDALLALLVLRRLFLPQKLAHRPSGCDVRGVHEAMAGKRRRRRKMPRKMNLSHRERRRILLARPF
mmetsp:Transcript_2914/g.11810  ORF Transcript_2914/g.11810 Transcript_2914/m.11810 type:complete len:224 (-) Transcript_2914:108-779(-)